MQMWQKFIYRIYGVKVQNLILCKSETIQKFKILTTDDGNRLFSYNTV